MLLLFSEGPPRWQKKKSGGTILVAPIFLDISMDCFAEGIPTPNIKWLHNNKTLERPNAKVRSSIIPDSSCGTEEASLHNFLILKRILQNY